ncbi:hypothetical protein F4775DRAFT_478380 [Biscogniauxia sp. FL1348]|nr:hypothetical protein F4775DRAFT_478380 [Biscogniauxia sp. FL1348]
MAKLTDRNRRRSESPPRQTGRHSEDRNEYRRRDDRERDHSSSSRHRHNNKHEHGSRRHHNHHHHRRYSFVTDNASPQEAPASLPFDARTLSRNTHDLDAFRPLLARYLDVQKQLDITQLDEREVRGRWKRFARRWNAGELAEGWYSPEVFEEARAEFEEVFGKGGSGWKENGGGGEDRAKEEKDVRRRGGGGGGNDKIALRGDEVAEKNAEDGDGDEEDDDDGYGPTLPSQQSRATAARHHGPNIPTLQDLSLRTESQAEERATRAEQLRFDRRADRAEQKARLEELAPPRADPGTRERRLEKKREVGEAVRGFRERKSPGAAEVGDSDLYGGGGGGGEAGGPGSLEEYKRMKAAAERKKTERELRREEIMRAKAAEREERIRAYKEREEGVLKEMREIARLRFG